MTSTSRHSQAATVMFLTFFVNQNKKSSIEQGHHSHFLCNPSRDTRADVSLKRSHFGGIEDWGSHNTKSHLHLSDPMIRVRRTRGESSCRGEKMPMLCIERLFGLACQGNEGSVHPFTLHTAMRRTVPCWLAGWHTLKDQQSNHLALARCWLRHGWSQTRGAGEP